MSVRFRKPEQIIEAVQFDGDWNRLADQLGWTVADLTDRWPKVDMDYDGTMYSPARHDHRLRPMPINVGDWVILEDGDIQSFATDGWFDGWERL